MFAWLRVFGYSPADLSVLCEDIKGWLSAYRRSRDMLFMEDGDRSKLIVSGVGFSDTEESSSSAIVIYESGHNTEKDLFVRWLKTQHL